MSRYTLEELQRLSDKELYYLFNLLSRKLKGGGSANDRQADTKTLETVNKAVKKRMAVGQ